MREYLPLGVRVTRFAVEAEVDGQWRRLAEAQCIGAQRIVRLDRPIAARRVRLVVLEAPVCPAITEFALFRAVAPVLVARPTANAPDVLSTAGWRIVEASAPGAETLLDDDASTLWITPAPTPGHPVQATIDLGALRKVAGFSLTPSRAVMTGAAPPKGYRAETSEDGQHWQPAGAGELSNIAYALDPAAEFPRGPPDPLSAAVVRGNGGARRAAGDCGYRCVLAPAMSACAPAQPCAAWERRAEWM